MGKYEVQFDGFESIKIDGDDSWQATIRCKRYWRALGYNMSGKEIVLCKLVEEYISGWNFAEVES